MTKNTLSKLLLIAALLLSTVTRGYKLGEAPAGLYVDEAGQGYSAYSVLLTGKDEFSMPFPAVFRSFTDFKTPVYLYSIIPFIPTFGLTPLSVRLPSFVSSILTIFVLYGLLKHLTKKDSLIPGIAVLLLSISPWHILFGRTNFECNLALFLLLSGMYTFMKGATRPYLYTISCILFAIALPAYHAQRIIAPLMVLFLLVTERDEWTKPNNRKWIATGVVVALIICIPTFIVSATPGFLARANGLNIFSHSRQLPAGFLSHITGRTGSIVNSSIFLSTQEFVSLYSSYFSPRNMFWLGDFAPRSSFPMLSTFFLWQLPLYLGGLWILMKGIVDQKLRNFTIFFLLISPLPAAVTRDPYATIRALQMVIPVSIIMSIALERWLTKLHKKVPTFGITIAISALVLYSLLKLYSSVIVLNEYYRARDWDFGWREVVEVIKTLPADTPIVVDNSREESYIELLFFLSYDPVRYQQDHPFNTAEYYTNMQHETTKRIGSIVTRPINWETDIVDGNVLIGDELTFSEAQMKEHNLSLVQDIFYPNGELAFRVVEVEKKQ